MSISGYECEIITQVHKFGCHGLSVAMIYGQGKQTRKSGKSQGISFSRSCGNPVNHAHNIIKEFHIQYLISYTEMPFFGFVRYFTTAISRRWLSLKM